MSLDADSMLDQALACARRGWPVFPCQPGTKRPSTRHGFLDATIDPSRIEYWWRRQPQANLGIATGGPGPDVLDIDQHGPAGHGFTACLRLAEAGLLDGAGTIVATPGAGLHLYFTGSSQPTRRLPRRHIDFRAAGGCILAPPSHIGGRPYRLLATRPQVGTLNWQAVTELLEPARDQPPQRQRAAAADPGRLAAWVARLPPGNRNSGLFWAACRAAESGQPGLLDDLARAAAATGLPDSEITATINSARRTARNGTQRRHHAGTGPGPRPSLTR